MMTDAELVARMDRPTGRVADDGMAFNDPAAWGYCDICAFLVAAKDGVRLEHRYDRTHPHDTELCTGGGRPSVTPVPAHATRLKMISLVKSVSRADRRAYWQRRRWMARNVEGAATIHIGPVTYAAITNLETGEQTDLTGLITEVEIDGD